MGLAERQALAAFKENQLPARKDALKEALGSDVEVNLQENGFTVDALSWVGDSFFKRFTQDVEEICSDKLGKEAMNEAVKKISIIYTPEKKSFKMDLANGMFTITANWDGSAGDDYPGLGDYKTYFMSKL